MIFQAERGFRPGRRPPGPATVTRTTALTPGMRRLTLTGTAVRELLQSDTALEPTAWLKVYPPGRDGRAYTIRGFNRSTDTIDIDVVLHDDARGHDSVADWARTAKAGDELAIGGARSGSFMLMPDSRWIWIAVDASALPAAHVILERLPAHVVAYVTVDVANERERQDLHTLAELHETWRFSDATVTPTLPAIDATMQTLPGQIWITGESGWARRASAGLQTRFRFDEARASVKGYWKIGESGHRDGRGREHRR